MKTNSLLKPTLLTFIVFYITLTYVNAQIYIQDPSALRTMVSVSSVMDLVDVEDTIIVNFNPDDHFYLGITMNELDSNIAGIVVKSYAGKNNLKRGNVYTKNSYNRATDRYNKLKNLTNYSMLTCGMKEMVVQITLFERMDMPPKRKTITIINENVVKKQDDRKDKRAKAVKSIIELVGIVSALM
ncbi:MAG: hypothetical protein KJO64_04380 [Bacteroidia bacterium]|nr:hypothetical protein [Bacteroidia bacterium]NNC85123.1 hypothetical protein [Bacteroidia bacterium]